MTQANLILYLIRLGTTPDEAYNIVIADFKGALRLLNRIKNNDKDKKIHS